MLLTYLLNYAIFISTTKQKAVAPTKNEPPPIKKRKVAIIIAKVKNYDKNIFISIRTYGHTEAQKPLYFT